MLFRSVEGDKDDIVKSLFFPWAHAELKLLGRRSRQLHLIFFAAVLARFLTLNQQELAVIGLTKLNNL